MLVTFEDRSVAVVSSVWLKGANSCHWPPENAKSVNRETLDCSTILKTLSLQDPQCVRLTNKNIYLNTVDRGNMGTRVIWAHRCNFFTYCCHKATPNESSSVFWLWHECGNRERLQVCNNFVSDNFWTISSMFRFAKNMEECILCCKSLQCKQWAIMQIRRWLAFDGHRYSGAIIL